MADMQDRPLKPRTLPKRDVFGFVILVLSLLLFNGCSTGLRLMNLANMAVNLPTLAAMDSMKVKPDVIRYTGRGEAQFRVLDQDLRIQGDHANRPIWQSSPDGCLSIENGASVHILDFNFDGGGSEKPVIRVSSGDLILENCDFFDSETWMIEVGPAAALELRETRFSQLGRGAVHLLGGRLRLSHASFNNAGETAVKADSGRLVEAHDVRIFNALSSGMNLQNVSEVWLDTLIVGNAFQDGVLLKDCAYAFISETDLRENGRHGLSLSGSTIAGLLGVRTLGNLVNGLTLNDVDSLRILGSEFVGNGNDGADIAGVDHLRLANVHFGHNAGSGLLLKGGVNLLVENGRFQGNVGFGGQIDSTQNITILNSQVINNSTGISVSNFHHLSLHKNLLVANRESALAVSKGTLFGFRHNLLRENGVGILAREILNASIDSCRIEANILGSDLRSLSRLTLHENLWNANQSASYFADMGLIFSKNDIWSNNKKAGIEVLSAEELSMDGARLVANHDGMLFNQVPVTMTTCRIDSGTGMALQAMNSKLSLTNTDFTGNHTAIFLREGSKCDVVQGKFQANDEILFSEGASEVFISYCDVIGARKGVTMGNYGKLEILSSRFTEIDGYCVEAPDPHIQSLLLRQNLIHHCGGVLRSKSISGQIELINNTLADMLGCIELEGIRMSKFNQNICWKTQADPTRLRRMSQEMIWNCFEPGLQAQGEVTPDQGDLFLDPLFTTDYYLKPNSPCLKGGLNGTLIGARGIIPITRPVLQP